MGPGNIINLDKERRRRGPRFDGGLMNILEVSRDLVCICREGRISAINGAGARLLGAKSSEQLMGRSLVDFLIPDYGPVMELFLSGKASEDKAVPVRLVGIDHMTCDVEMQIYRAREIAPDAAVVVCRDISREGRLAGTARDSDARFSLLVEHAMNLVCHVRDGNIRYINRAGIALLGLDDGQPLIGQPIDVILTGDYAGVLSGELLETVLVEGAIPMRLKRADGKAVDVMIAVTRLPGKGAVELMVEARDLGGLNRAIAALRRSGDTLEMRVAERTRELAAQRALTEERKHIADAARRFTESLLDAIPGPVWFKDARGQIQSCNQAFRTLFGCDPSQQPETLAGVLAAMPDECVTTDQDLMSGATERAVFEASIPSANGGTVEALVSKCGLTDDEGRIVGIIGVITDITERKGMERELQRLATTDPLTGAFNRRHFRAQAHHELDRAIRYSHPVSVLMLDIDHFKRVNDTNGHAVGDEALKALVITCHRELRDLDVLGRMGGEEFAVLLPETPTSGAVEVAERLRQAIAAIRVPLSQGGTLAFTASIGVATRMDNDADLDGVLARADDALYRAKQQGRNRVELG